jgi:hypothetical protein
VKAAKEKALKKAETLQKAETKAAKQAAKQKATTAKSTSVFPDEATLKKSQGKKDTRKKAPVTHPPIRVSPPRSAKKRNSPVIPPKGRPNKKLKFTAASTKPPTKHGRDKASKSGT